MATDLFGTIGELFSDPLKAWDKFRNGRTSDVAEENLQYQRDNLEYQKAIQQQIFQREDTQYQRTVNDMRQAGMSPLSMSSTDGAGQTISTTAPVDTFQEQQTPMQSLQQILGMIQGGQTLAAGQASIGQTNAQTELIKAQANKTQAESDQLNSGRAYWDNNAAEDSRRKGYETMQIADNAIENQNAKNWLQSHGLNTAMSNQERNAKLYQTGLGLNNDSSYEQVYTALGMGSALLDGVSQLTGNIKNLKNIFRK